MNDINLTTSLGKMFSVAGIVFLLLSIFAFYHGCIQCAAIDNELLVLGIFFSILSIDAIRASIVEIDRKADSFLHVSSRKS